jgi:hypothetical protein
MAISGVVFRPFILAMIWERVSGDFFTLAASYLGWIEKSTTVYKPFASAGIRRF